MRTPALRSSARMSLRNASLSATVMVSALAMTGIRLTYGCSRRMNSMSTPLRLWGAAGRSAERACARHAAGGSPPLPPWY
eukprot:scaffold7258_cov122-Isochrysis_galbana.AAC.12